MNVLLPLLILASVRTPSSNGKNISATGGGIVKEGGDLVLKYEVDRRWDRCFWYWYEDHDRCGLKIELGWDVNVELLTRARLITIGLKT